MQELLAYVQLLVKCIKNVRFQFLKLSEHDGQTVAKCSNPTETAYMMIEHHCKVTETDGHVIVHAEPA